ncbi:Rootletin, partial [Ophiophagus hannah]
MSSSGPLDYSVTLEDTVLHPRASRDDKALTVRGEGDKAAPVTIPARIRQIITQSLSDPSSSDLPKTDLPANMQEENRLLQKELSRLEDLLAHTHAEKDELASKYQAISERLQQAQRAEEEGSTAFLQMRQQFKSDEKAHKRKMQAFQDGQQHQAQLVQKMQNKILQYKKRCGELEQELLEKTSECERHKQMVCILYELQTRLDSTELRLRRIEHDNNTELENTLIHLEKEQQSLYTHFSNNLTLLTEVFCTMCKSRFFHCSFQSYDSYLSNEHSGILLLWRQAATLRGNFAELRTTVERGLAEAGTDMARASRRLQTACLNLDSNLRLSENSSTCLLEKQLREKVREMIQLQSSWDGERAVLNSKITELTTLGDKLKEQNTKKDKTISAFKMDIQKLEASKIGDLEEMKDLKEETESLQHTLKSITKLALAESKNIELISKENAKALPEEDTIWHTYPLGFSSPQHQWATQSRIHSPSCQNAAIQAVQALIQKSQQREQELHVQLESCRDILGSVKKQLADCQQEMKAADQQLQEQKQECEELTRALEDCRQKAQHWKSSVEVLEREKEAMEIAVESQTQQLDASHLEVERLKSMNGGLQKQRKLLEEQKEDAIKEKERTRKELERGQRSLEQLEEKMSILKKELVNVKESLNQAMLEKDVLESAKEGLSKALSKLEDEKSKLVGRKQELEHEQVVWREQLAHFENEQMHMRAEKQELEQSCQASEEKGQMLEGEITLLRRERVQLQDQMMQTDSLIRVLQEKEEIAKEKAQLAVELTAMQRQKKLLTEETDTLRMEKESLETSLFEAQELTAQLEARKEQLEGENQGIGLSRKALQVELGKIRQELELQENTLRKETEKLKHQLTQTEEECQLSMKHQKQAFEEDLATLRKEKEILRLALMEEKDETVNCLQQEKEELVSKYEAEKRELMEEILTLQQRRDESLLMLENEKQKSGQCKVDKDDEDVCSHHLQVVSQKEAEKNLLVEKLSELQRELKYTRSEMEQVKLDSLKRQEQDKNTITSINKELQTFQAQFEDAMAAHQKEAKRLNEHIKELAREKELSGREVEQFKVQLRLAEDTYADVHKELTELHQRLQESEEACDQRQKELLEFHRAVADESREKEALQKSNADLRTAVKKTENEKLRLQRIKEEREQKIAILEEAKAAVEVEVEEFRVNLREVEKAHMEARRELQELRREVKSLESKNSKKTQEVTELQHQLLQKEQQEQQNSKEVLDLKQKISTLEIGHDSAHKEMLNLQKKLSSAEVKSQLQEQDLKHSLAENCIKEKKWKDELHRLEVKLQEVSRSNESLQLRLSTCEGCIHGLETELAKTEATKREVELKLVAVHSTLRRTLGLGSRSPSPQRSSSPVKGTSGRQTPASRTGSPERSRSRSPFHQTSPLRSEQTTSEIDPEVVRDALKDFLQELRDTQRERDDLRIQVMNMSHQLNEMEADRDQTQSRILQLQKYLADCEEGLAQVALMLQEETIRKTEQERQASAEQVLNLERNLRICQDRNKELQVGIFALSVRKNHFRL